MTDNNALKLACIGGGTGLSSLLSGIKKYTSAKRDQSEIIDINNLAAVVSVFDDGGSTGRLIEEFDVLPPGDTRKLLYSLSDADELLARLFEYRFSSNGDLGGHTVGNLLLIALTELSEGSFPKAIQAASELLAVRGRIIPVSLDYTMLCAELADGEVVSGESQIPNRRNREPIRRVFLAPRENGKAHPHVSPDTYQCVAHREAIETIENADVIIIGPGSLYTSIMPNLVVKGIVDAIQASDAMKIYICNVMTQPGETDGYSVTDHVQAIYDHADVSLDYVVVNSQPAPDELVKKYVQKELSELLTRIQSRAEEGLTLLEDNKVRPTDLVMSLTNYISQISDETREQMADTSKVQVMYDFERDNIEGGHVVEADIIRDTVVIENGVQLNVIRHDPEKLARTLIKVLGDHPKLQETV
ncbi:MAG: YvcK family protein [Candidatus Poribacteria bacterium]|nr:YvcK family protein [Candidatus Poribacteria bacterium]